MTDVDPKWIDAAAREAAAVILFSAIETKGDIATASDAIARRVISLIVPLARAEVLTDLRAKAEGMHVAPTLNGTDVVWRADVMALIEEAQHETT